MRAGVTAERVSRAAAVLERIALVPIDAGILGRAADLEPPDLRTLAAIHRATALLLRQDIAGGSGTTALLLGIVRQHPEPAACNTPLVLAVTRDQVIAGAGL